MKKILSIALALSLSVAVLASCGKKPSEPSSTNTDNSATSNPSINSTTSEPNATPFVAKDIPKEYKADGKNVKEKEDGGVEVELEERKGDDSHVFEVEDLGFIDTESGALIKMGMTVDEIENLIGKPRVVDGKNYRIYDGIVIKYDNEGSSVKFIVAMGNMNEDENVTRYSTPRGINLSSTLDQFKSVYGDEYQEGSESNSETINGAGATMAMRYFAKDGSSYKYLGQSYSKEDKPENDADLIWQTFLFDTANNNVSAISIENGAAE